MSRRKVNTKILIADLELRKKEKKITMTEIAKKHNISRARIYKYLHDTSRTDLLVTHTRNSDIDFE